MTPTLRWPNTAANQRDAAAEAAVRGIRALAPIVDGATQFDRTELLRRQATALTACWEIAGLLKAAGAPIRLDNC